MRPLKLTPEVHEIIVTAVAAGCYRHEAAHIASIAPSTLRTWERQGEQELLEEVDPTTHTRDELRKMARKAKVPVSGNKATIAARLVGTSPASALSAALKTAHASRTVAWREEIEAIAGGGAVVRETFITKKNGDEVHTIDYSTPRWTGFAWLLERTRPDDYARRDRVEDEEARRAADPAVVLAEGEARMRRLRAVPDE